MADEAPVLTAARAVLGLGFRHVLLDRSGVLHEIDGSGKGVRGSRGCVAKTAGGAEQREQEHGEGEREGDPATRRARPASRLHPVDEALTELVAWHGTDGS